MRKLAALSSALLSPSVQSAAVYAFTGLGFAGANLILAKALAPREYALLALVVSIISLAAPLAPLGADGVINRQLLSPAPRTLARAAGTSALVALAAAALGRLVYGLDLRLVALIVPGVLFGGITIVASAVYQRFHRFIGSLLLAQSFNLFFIFAAVLVLAGAFHGIRFPIVLIAVGFLVTALWSWTRLLGKHRQEGGRGRFSWREALHYTGVNGASVVLLQLERLLIPKVLSLEALASFGVLAAVAIAPYRTLQMGAAFSVLPRLRAVETIAARRRLILKELLVLGALVAAGSVALLYLAPVLFELLFAGKYTIPRQLIVAAVVTGGFRVLGGLSKGVATALCTTRELALFNTLIWISVGLAILGGVAGARWGLTGLLYGIGLGWVARVLFSAWVSWPHLRDGDSGPGR